MNLLEIIQEYLRLKATPGEDADAWLNAMHKDNEWPDEMVMHIRGCWVDKNALALKEARRVMELYEINPEKFKCSIIERTSPKQGETHDEIFRVKAVHIDNDYSWIAYEVFMVLDNHGSADDECTRISIRDIDG